MSRGQELTCLHTAQDGQIWSVNSDGNPQIYPHLGNPAMVRAGTYLALGCPENYRLITQLYSTLNQKDDAYCFLVGSPAACKGHNQNVAQVLSRLSSLSVQGSLVNCWHRADGKIFNTLLLLQYFHLEGVNDLVRNVFDHNCLQRSFDFMGLDSLELAVQLMAEIVDPRWFLNPKRPHSLSRIESYFGLKPAQFRKACGPALIPATANHRRALLLLDIVKELPKDRFVETETRQIENENVRKVAMCRRVLGFIVRSWLTELQLPGYFDPGKFFKQAGNLADYQRQLEE